MFTHRTNGQCQPVRIKPWPNLTAHLKSVGHEVTRSPPTSWLSGPLLAQRRQPRFLAPPSPSPSCCCSIHQTAGLSMGQVYVEGSQKESGRASLPVCRWRAPESGDDWERGVFAPRGGIKRGNVSTSADWTRSEAKDTEGLVSPTCLQHR